MSQYGMNGMNGYIPQQYQQVQSPYVNNDIQYASGINWANGISDAKAFRIKPNDKVIILDSENEGVMYIKVSDSIGMCTLRAFRFNEVTDQLINNKNNKNNTDMSDILDEQDCEVEEYEKKIGKLFGKK